MKFVSPDTVQIPLADGQWIEVKKHLSAIEEKRFRSAGLRRMSQRKGDNDEPQNEVDIDWAAMAFARVVTYLVDWSAKMPSGVRMAVSKDAIGQLDSDSFEEIDNAIQAHIEKMAEEKKAPSGKPSLTAV
jgi:hypothetical protein